MMSYSHISSRSNLILYRLSLFCISRSYNLLRCFYSFSECISLRNFTHRFLTSDVLAYKSNVRVFVYIENMRSSNSMGSLCLFRTLLALYPTLISMISSHPMNLNCALSATSVNTMDVPRFLKFASS